MNDRFVRTVGRISTVLFLMVMSANAVAQEGEFSVRIKQPVQDTLFVCPGQSVIFMAEGQNTDGSSFDPNQAIFSWDFGDQSNLQNGANISYEYDQGGHYKVVLYVSGSQGQAALNAPSREIYVSVKPTFNGTRSDRSNFCSGAEIMLTGFVQPVSWQGVSESFVNEYVPSDYVWSGVGIQSDRNGVARIKPPLDLGHLKYTFRAKDDFGCYFDTTLTIYGVYASYTFDPAEGEAPLEVNFTTDSVSNGGTENAVTYTWEFYEVTDSTQLLSSSQPTFTFERPGQYYNRLIASYEQCRYTYVHEDLIQVDSSRLEIHNVFTPNEDGSNDYFQVKSRSLKYFSGKIINRWGHLVYEWSDWKTAEAGWNGTYQNTGKPAPSGTYYYIIIADGYDDVKYKGKEYKGFLTLIR